MKKNVLRFIVFLMVIIVMCYSQTLTIVNPRVGARWYKGKTHTIKWSVIGKINKNISILLINAKTDGIEKIIATKVVNKGSFNWVISKTIPDGSYRIRIETEDSLFSASSGVFYIGNKNRKNKRISVISPSKEKIEKICKNDYLKIKWENPTFTDNINIKILKLNNSNICNFDFYPDAMVSKDIPNTGKYDYSISSGFLAGMYRIKFTKGKEVTYSNCFRILSHCYVDPSEMKKIREYKFKPVFIRGSSELSLGKKQIILDLSEIVKTLNIIKNGKFEIAFINKGNKKILFYMFNKKAEWKKEHIGNKVILKEIINHNDTKLKIEISNLDSATVINTVKVINTLRFRVPKKDENRKRNI
jgi:hypothetical protein